MLHSGKCNYLTVLLDPPPFLINSDNLIKANCYSTATCDKQPSKSLPKTKY